MENNDKLTMISQVIVEKLKEWKAVPAIGRLLLDHVVHVDGKKRPEYLLVFD